MGYSVGRDRAAKGSSPGGESSGSRDVPGATSVWSTAALRDRLRAKATDPTKEVPAETQQRRERIPSCSASWSLGHDLIDRHEYGQAAESFRRTLLSAEASVDPLSIEAAEVAAELCDALSCEQSVERKLRDALGVLPQDLSQLSYEEVSFARGALAARSETASSAAYFVSPTLAPNEATATVVGEASSPVKAYRSFASRPGLRVCFLGHFELLQDGEVMYLGRNARALTILKYLLVHRGDRPVPRDHLLGWLWPESAPKRARWSLNSAIYTLRKLLGSCLPSLPASETVLFEEGGYRISPHIPTSTDVDEFDSRYEEGRRLEDAGRAPEAVSEYEKAAELYRGDYLIEDLYEEWTMIERERLIDAYADLLRRLAVRYTEVGQPWESVKTYYQILEKDRCDEYTHRLLMECYVRLGQRARALRQYGLCERALSNEYAMAPSPETRTLYANILKDGGCR